MPTISMFYGILVKMYWNDHALPDCLDPLFGSLFKGAQSFRNGFETQRAGVNVPGSRTLLKSCFQAALTFKFPK